MNVPNNPQDLWNRTAPTLPEPNAAEICTLARRRERESVWTWRISVLALAGFVVAFAHNAWQLAQPWVRLGQGWMLVVVTVYLWQVIHNRRHRRITGDSCGSFLLRSLQMKRDGYSAARRLVLLIIPAVLASWWGGGAALKARAMGLHPDSLYYRYLTSAWPMIATCVLLLVIWFAFTIAATRASAEFDALRRRFRSL